MHNFFMEECVWETKSSTSCLIQSNMAFRQNFSHEFKKKSQRRGSIRSILEV